jgi:hypothetical protein
MLQKFFKTVFSLFAPALKVTKIVAKFQVMRFCPEQIGVEHAFLMCGAIADKPLY